MSRILFFTHKNIAVESLSAFNNVIDWFVQEHKPFLTRQFLLHVFLLSTEGKSFPGNPNNCSVCKEQRVASIDPQQRKKTSINSLFHYGGMTAGHNRKLTMFFVAVQYN